MDIDFKVLRKNANTRQKRELKALLDVSFPENKSVNLFDLQQKCKLGNSPKLILEILISMNVDGDIYLLDLLTKCRPSSGRHVGSGNVVWLLADMGEKCTPFITRNVSKGSEDIGSLMAALDLKGILPNEILDLGSKTYRIDSSKYAIFMDALSFDSAMYIISKRKAENSEDFRTSIPAAMRSLSKLSKFGRFKDINGQFIADSAYRDAIFVLNDSVADVTLDSTIRRIAADALGNIGDRNSVKNLLKIVSDNGNEFVRGSAALALGKIGDTSVVPMLNEIFSKQYTYSTIEDDRKYSRQGIISPADGILEALAILKDQSSVDLFVSLLQSKSARQNYKACLLVGSFQNQMALPLLENIISSNIDEIDIIDYIEDLDDDDDYSGNKTASAQNKINIYSEIISAALLSLGSIGAPWSAKTARYFIGRKEKIIRESAILALVKLTSPSDVLFSSDILGLLKLPFEEGDGQLSRKSIVEALSIIASRYPDEFIDILINTENKQRLLFNVDMRAIFCSNPELTSSLLKRMDVDYPLETRLSAIYFLRVGCNLNHIRDISSFKTKGCGISMSDSYEIVDDLKEIISDIVDSSILSSYLSNNDFKKVKIKVLNGLHFDI